jgi:hypothetical protein
LGTGDRGHKTDRSRPGLVPVTRSIRRLTLTICRHLVDLPRTQFLWGAIKNWRPWSPRANAFAVATEKTSVVGMRSTDSKRVKRMAFSQPRTAVRISDSEPYTGVYECAQVSSLLHCSELARTGRFRRVRRSLRVQRARRKWPKPALFRAFSCDFLGFLQLTGMLS